MYLPMQATTNFLEFHRWKHNLSITTLSLKNSKMTTKLTFLMATVAAMALNGLNETKAQNVSPYWSLAGNSNASTSSKLGTTNAKPLRLLTKNVERMRIDTLGRVGIGTTAPGTLFEVRSTSNGQMARFNGGTAQMYVALFENNVGRGYIGSYAGSNEDVDFGTSTNNSTGRVHLTIKTVPKLTINAAGNVGIGTTLPAYPLDVNGRIRIRGVDASNTAGVWLNNVANTAVTGFIGVAQDKRIGFYGAGSGWSLIMNTDNGNVGIGTFNPAYKLSVHGTIQATEIRVETGWADYVFDNGYKLPPLTDVANYIAEHRHLPGIPSAEAIQKDGLAVGEVQTKMMEKIEELTLYVIDLQKQIAELKAEKK
jgi:hypothetical protein